MAEEKKKEEVKKEEKKGFFGKLKEHAADKEEQLEILSTFVRLGILVWSGAILTLAYVELPSALKIPKQDLDPTFIGYFCIYRRTRNFWRTNIQERCTRWWCQWWSIKSRYGEVDCSSITNCTSTNYSY